MNRKSFYITLLLLGTTALSNAFGQQDTRPSAPTATTNGPGVQVIAYYFHGMVRCETCLDIEKQAREIIERRFQAELATNGLVFRPVNYDLKENSHFLQDYRLQFPSLVLVRRENAQDVKWKSLVEAWMLVRDPAAFDQFLRREVGVYLSASGNPTGSADATKSSSEAAISDSTPGTRVDSLAGMNAGFADMNAAFVFVHGTNKLSSVSWEPINRARRALESEWDIKVGVFELNLNQNDYRRLAERHVFRLPAVMMVLQNGTTTLFSGEVTETNLVQKFTYTVSVGGCCALGDD